MAFKSLFGLAGGMVNEKSRTLESNDVIQLYEIFFSEYGWTLNELMELPIPAFILTMNAMNKRLKPKKTEKQKFGKGI